MVGARAGNHFNQLHEMGRIEEMDACKTLRMLQSRSNACYRD